MSWRRFRKSYWSALLAGVVTAAGGRAFAVDFAWDPSGLGGGSGQWDTSLAVWDSPATAPDFNAGDNVTWASGASSRAFFGADTPFLNVATLGFNITAGSVNFAGSSYRIATGNFALQLNGGGAGMGLVDFTGSGGGSLALRNESGTSFNVNVRATTANGTISFDRLTSATNVTLGIGGVTVGAGRTLQFSGNHNYALQAGAVSNSGVITHNNVLTTGVIITGTYSGTDGNATGNSDFGTAAVDAIQSGGTGFAGGISGGVSEGSGGIHFANGSISYVGTLQLGASANSPGGNFFVEGKPDGLGGYITTTVHVTSAFKIYQGGASYMDLTVRNGGQLIIDAGAVTGYNAKPDIGTKVRPLLSGDGNMSNKIEFAGTTLDLGNYFHPSGSDQFNGGGALIGGLNLITHGAAWSLYGDHGNGITFGGVDGGGWTIMDNALTVSATGSGALPAIVTFDNSRFLDVQSAGLTFTGSANFPNLLIHDAKTITKKGSGALNINVAVDGGKPAGYTGTGILAVEAGTVNLNHATFNAGLNISGGVVHVNNSGGILALSSLTITGDGNLDLNDSDLIVNYAGGASPFDALRGAVNYGLTHASGITSTTGNVPPFDKVLAVVDNANHNFASLSGVTLTGLGFSGNQQVLGKYTYFGDANLDGKVTGADYTYIDLYLGHGDTIADDNVDWGLGDFNQDGKITGADYTYIDLNLGKGDTIGAPLAFEELRTEMMALHAAEFGASYTDALELLQNSVPEPANVSLLGLGMFVLRLRLRRSR